MKNSDHTIMVTLCIDSSSVQTSTLSGGVTNAFVFLPLLEC